MGWKYISNTIDAHADLAVMDCTLCFVGHTHIPGVYADYELRRKDKMTILSRQGKTIINVGSIGQPRDGSSQLAFAVFDDVDWNVEIIRLDYEYQETMRKIEKTSLPSFLAKRLMVGI
jgi:diadenosine tetraphosphatase ApaH/serine/threonine PP2A family protein phosphatase